MNGLLRSLCVACIALNLVPITHGAARPRWLAINTGVSGLFDNECIPAVMLDYRAAANWQGFHPWAGVSWATDGAIFAGAGIVYSAVFSGDRWSISAGTAPGYYERHEGVDLGSHMEFYSFAEIGRKLPSGHRLTLRIAHISNGGVTETNPGAELLLLGYAIPLP